MDDQLINVDTKSVNCQYHGDYTSKALIFAGKIMDWSTCPKCLAIKKENDQMEKVRKKDAEERESRARRLGGIGVPKRFQDRTFDNFIVDQNIPGQVKAHRMCKKFGENFSDFLEAGTGFIMVGNCGSGKTHLAMAIANRLVDDKFIVLVENCYLLLAGLKSAISENRIKSEILKYAEPDLLIIDEVGSQAGTDTDLRLLDALLQERYTAGRCTIMTSNLEYKSQLKPLLGTKIISRFQEGGGRIMPFNWPDYRPKIKTEGLWD